MGKIVVPIYFAYGKKKKKTILVGMNWYRNAHFQISNKVKTHYHKLVKDQVSKIKTPVKIDIVVYISRKGTDPHNVRSIIEKFVFDGLVECGAIPNDTLDYITGGSWEAYYDKKNPRVEILW
jgi:hypothetical protein